MKMTSYMGDHMAKSKTLPHKNVLNDLFRYDSKAGVLLWRHRPHYCFKSLRDADAWNSRYCNTPAGNSINGYLRVSISGERYLVHRVIYKMITGLEPEIIDHIDGNPRNNRIDNLRSVSVTENAQNAALPVTNQTGCRGVQWSARRKKWRASITANRKFIHLGVFENIDEAMKARKNAEALYGFHPNHGRAIKALV